MGDAAFDPVAIAADDWLCGPGIGDNAIAVATAVGVCERVLPEPTPIAIVFTVGEEGLGGLRGARHACRELASEAVLALEGHGSDRVFTTAVGSLRVRFTVTGPGGRSWWNRGRPSAVHELVRLLDGMIAAASAQLPVNVGCCEGEDMHAPTEQIRADSIAVGARQLRAVLAEVLELTPGPAQN